MLLTICAQASKVLNGSKKLLQWGTMIKANDAPNSSQICPHTILTTNLLKPQGFQQYLPNYMVLTMMKANEVSKFKCGCRRSE